MKKIWNIYKKERLWINDNRFTGSLPNFNDALKLKPNMSKYESVCIFKNTLKTAFLTFFRFHIISLKYSKEFLYMDSNEFSGKITEEFTYYMPNLRKDVSFHKLYYYSYIN